MDMIMIKCDKAKEKIYINFLYNKCLITSGIVSGSFGIILSLIYSRRQIDL